MSSSSETAEERKVGVDPKLLFPVKLWLQSWLPSQRERWNSKTGLPMSDDKEDWVQLGERKHDPGCKEQVGSHTFNNLLRCFPTDIWNRPNYRSFSWKEEFMFFTTRSFLRTWRSMNAFLHTPVTFSSGFAAHANRLHMPQPFLSLFPHPWHK